MKSREKNMTIGRALLPIVFLVAAILLNNIYGNGESVIPLIAASSIAAIIAMLSGYSWNELEEGVLESIGLTIQACLILMIIGMIIGTWILAGVVPTIIYYGLQILSPNFFLVATVILCIVISIATGSSWTTIGTIGVALVGIGQGLGIPVGMTAGAIVSGAYFGDKISPLSDNTNMGSGVLGVDLYVHIKHMMYTSIPSLIISLILFFIIGRNYTGATMDYSQIELITNGIQQQFVISPLLLMVPIMIILVVILKVPAIPGLILSFLAGGIAAIFVQGASIVDIVESAHFGYSSSTGIELIDTLLSKGGLDGMMYTISLIICAMTFGGILEKSDMLEVILNKVSSLVKSDSSLIATSTLTSLMINIVTGDQALSIILPSRMYKDAFEERKLDLKNLSRCSADGGVVTSPIVPWNVCGVFVATTLGVSTLTYLPYSFFCLLSPLVSVIGAFAGYSIAKTNIINENLEEELV